MISQYKISLFRDAGTLRLDSLTLLTQSGLVNALLFFISFFAIGTTPGAWMTVATFSSVVAIW